MIRARKLRDGTISGQPEPTVDQWNKVFEVNVRQVYKQPEGDGGIERVRNRTLLNSRTHSSRSLDPAVFVIEFDVQFILHTSIMPVLPIIQNDVIYMVTSDMSKSATCGMQLNDGRDYLFIFQVHTYPSPLLALS